MAHYPLFSLFTDKEIAEATGYSEAYVNDIRRRNIDAPEIFRLKCSKALGATESELFGQQTAA